MPNFDPSWFGGGPDAFDFFENKLRAPNAAGAASSVTITPAKASLALTTFAPAVKTPRTITPAKTTLVLSTFAPAVKTPRLVTPAKASLSLATFAPSVATPRLVTPAKVALTLSTFAPTIRLPRLVTPPTVALTLSGYPPVVVIPGVAATLPDGGGTLPLIVPIRVKAPLPLVKTRIQLPEVAEFAIRSDDDAIVALYVAGALDLEELAALLAA
jgi:hypothetical protein